MNYASCVWVLWQKRTNPRSILILADVLSVQLRANFLEYLLTPVICKSMYSYRLLHTSGAWLLRDPAHRADDPALPREVVKMALSCNASAVIFAHNHPSGVAEPSRADKAITKRLKDALVLVDVRVLDHLIVGNEVTSFAERGVL